MRVVATAGHVDHGKSTLVRALTGMEPDRWAEERRRGMTIDLGFAWTPLPSGEIVAFVDVPGHEKFLTNMLAGVGPAPAVMVVVAADEGWMPQSAEHLAAIDALDVRHGLLVVTRCDLAEPGRALREAREEIAATSLGEVAAVTVSGATGAGLDDLRAALDRMLAGMPSVAADGPVRLWVDRSFTVRGSGTVVTGTLPSGTVGVGEELLLGDRAVRVRGLQSLKEPVASAAGPARVALNLRGVAHDEVRRGMALVTPGAWTPTSLVDVRVPSGSLPREPVVHVGSAAVAARARPLGDACARLSLSVALPLHVGDRLLVRDPGSRRVVAARVLDVAPPPLRRRGAAAARAATLEGWPMPPDAAAFARDRGVVHRGALRAMGVSRVSGVVGVGDWLVDPLHLEALRRRLRDVVAQADPLGSGPSVEAVRAALGLPDRRLVEALVADVAELRVEDGRVRRDTEVPKAVLAAVAALEAELSARRFAAPSAERLAELGLTAKLLAAGARAGLLLRLGEGVVLPAGADHEAAEILAGLPQPFTAADARRALDTSRRVAIPLLEHLDRLGRTERDPDGLRRTT